MQPAIPPFKLRSSLVAGLLLSLAPAIAHAQIDSFPYSEDFEASDGGYLSETLWDNTFFIELWEWGVPGTAFISNAASGTKAWVTNLDGDHGYLPVYLESPTFDFTGLSYDPILRFEHIYKLDPFGENGYVVTISIDDGPHTVLGAAGDLGSTHWYDGAPTFSNVLWCLTWPAGTTSWLTSSGAPGEWQTAQHVLEGAAGHRVKVRWLDFPSYDLSWNSDGMGVDNIEVFEPPVENGQAPSANVALLDVNDATGIAGLPPCLELPGPYRTTVSMSETLDFRIEGAPDVPVVLFYGRPGVAANTTIAGQFDIFSTVVFADGKIDPEFVTDALGEITQAVPVPTFFAGHTVGFQAAVPAASQRFVLSNAVFVDVVP